MLVDDHRPRTVAQNASASGSRPTIAPSLTGTTSQKLIKYAQNEAGAHAAFSHGADARRTSGAVMGRNSLTPV